MLCLECVGLVVVQLEGGWPDKGPNLHPIQLALDQVDLGHQSQSLTVVAVEQAAAAEVMVA
jgi:hypothetical protein